MRLDKFLQVSGLIKRRTIAGEACKRCLVKVNGSLAKATKEVREGDVVEIDLPRRYLKARLLQPLEKAGLAKNKRREFIEVIEDLAKENPLDDWDL